MEPAAFIKVTTACLSAPRLASISPAQREGGTYTDEPPALFLRHGNAFTLDADKKAIHTQRLTALNSDGTEQTDGYRLYLATDDTSVIAG